MIIDSIIAHWPFVAVILTVLAFVLAGLRAIKDHTKTKIDDKIVEVADKSGITNFLKRFRK